MTIEKLIELCGYTSAEEKPKPGIPCVLAFLVKDTNTLNYHIGVYNERLDRFYEQSIETRNQTVLQESFSHMKFIMWRYCSEIIEPLTDEQMGILNSAYQEVTTNLD